MHADIFELLQPYSSGNIFLKKDLVAKCMMLHLQVFPGSKKWSHLNKYMIYNALQTKGDTFTVAKLYLKNILVLQKPPSA